MMKDTMTNAWSAEMEDADDMLEEFLADSDEEDETILAPEQEYVKPMVSITGSLKNPTVPDAEIVDYDDEDEDNDDDNSESKKVVHDFF